MIIKYVKFVILTVKHVKDYIIIVQAVINNQILSMFIKVNAYKHVLTIQFSIRVLV